MDEREEAIKYLADKERALRCALPHTKGGWFEETVKEIQALNMAIEDMQKRTPKKPNEYEDKYYTCPECGNLLMHKWMVYPEKLMPRGNGLPCCLNCLQAIDWSDSE